MSLSNNSAESSALLSKGISSNIIYKAFTDKIVQLHCSSHKIVDVGCGTGNLINEVLKVIPSADITGVDIIDYDKLNSNFAYIKQDLNKDFNLSEQFDLTFSSEVIEHLENPRHFLRQLKKITQPSGHIILSTPNPTSLLSKLSFCLKGYHSSFGPKDYPAHITPITCYQMNNIVFEINGLKIIDTFYLNNGRIPGTATHWRRFFPFLKGPLFSDNYLVVLQNS